MFYIIAIASLWAYAIVSSNLSLFGLVSFLSVTAMFVDKSARYSEWGVFDTKRTEPSKISQSQKATVSQPVSVVHKPIRVQQRKIMTSTDNAPTNNVPNTRLFSDGSNSEPLVITYTGSAPQNQNFISPGVQTTQSAGRRRILEVRRSKRPLVHPVVW